MIPFTLYLANTSGDPKNCHYPVETAIMDSVSLEKAVCFDHVMALYQNNKRGRQGFIRSNCLPFDCDNDHSESPQDWVTPNDVANAFPMVDFCLSYSKSHMKDKKNRCARPRFHVFFPIPSISAEEDYMAWKQCIAQYFPYFDKNALDSARFFFGASEGTEICHGTQNVVEFMGKLEAKRQVSATQPVESHYNSSFGDDPGEFPPQQLYTAPKEFYQDTEQQQPSQAQQPQQQQGLILEGCRNSTMSHFAGKLLIRCGDSQETYEKFLKEAEKCSPPLDLRELSGIWYSAQKFFNRVVEQEKHSPPGEQAQNFSLKPRGQELSVPLKPTDFSDVGQASILAKEYLNKLAYSTATDFLVYNGSYWEESKQKAQAIAQELTARQLVEAEELVQKKESIMEQNGALDTMKRWGKKRAIQQYDLPQAMSYYDYETAIAYQNFAIKRRDSKNITATLKESAPMLLIQPEFLDKNEFLLNLPKGTYDLCTGTVREHNAQDFITKQTSVDPSAQGRALWEETLNTFFLGDRELIDYVQKVVGLCCLGKVYIEALIIAFGEGSNGKSTFWNVISRVLGTYGGNLSSDILTSQCRRNVKPELAEAKGKRMLIASELEEGTRLSTANLKQLCSTDRVVAEKKFKDTFVYTPSHTLILYTNHLPKVGAMDKGTWRRLIVIPFLAQIEGVDDKKNYADYLYQEAGGGILQWMLEGTQKLILDKFKPKIPEKVLSAMAVYKENNDWFNAFLCECCEIDPSYTEKSGQLYTKYRAYCGEIGDFARSTTDFYGVLEQEGYKKKRTKAGVFVFGLKLKTDFSEKSVPQ